jgi:hypothetical protein
MSENTIIYNGIKIFEINLDSKITNSDLLSEFYNVRELKKETAKREKALSDIVNVRLDKGKKAKISTKDYEVLRSFVDRTSLNLPAEKKEKLLETYGVTTSYSNLKISKK